MELEELRELSGKFAHELAEFTILYAERNPKFEENSLIEGLLMYLVVSMCEIKDGHNKDICSEVVEQLIINYENVKNVYEKVNRARD